MQLARTHQEGRGAEDAPTGCTFTEGWFRNSGFNRFIKWHSCGSFIVSKTHQGASETEKVTVATIIVVCVIIPYVIATDILNLAKKYQVGRVAENATNVASLL